MRTIRSALFIALCLLFVATYATALRRPGYKNLRRNFAKAYKPASDIRMWEPSPYDPTPRNYLLSESDLSIRQPEWTRPSPYNPNPRNFLMSDLSIRPDWTRPSPYNPYPRPLPMADRLWEAPVYTTYPVRPKYELYADRVLPYYPRPTPTFPYPGDFLADEEYDEEDWGVSGNVGSGGAWNLGGSYSNGGFKGTANVGNGGQWNAGASYTNGGFTGGANVGNNGQWSANAGYNTKVGGGDLSVGGQVSNGGNWGVGATYNLRF